MSKKVKAADLKIGDHIRVTLEGVVLNTAFGEYTLVDFNKGRGTGNAMFRDTLDAAGFEVVEPPLKVGDKVMSRIAPRAGEVLALHEHGGTQRAWVLWLHGTTISSITNVEFLERV